MHTFYRRDRLRCGWFAGRGRCTHETINHLERYVEGRVHTNGIENFEPKQRGLHGTYAGVERAHLFRYLGELMRATCASKATVALRPYWTPSLAGALPTRVLLGRLPCP